MYAAPASPPKSLRVAVLESSALLRESLQALLEKEGMVVPVAAPPVGAALTAISEAHCDAVLVHCAHTVGEMVTTIHEVQRLNNRPGVIVLDTPVEEGMVEAALHAGARGLLSRAAAPDEVVAALRAVDRFGAYVDPEIMTLLIRRVRTPQHLEQPIFTRREHEIMLLVADGLRIRDIASRLGLCDGTIKAHLHNAYRKLNADNRMQAVQMAREKMLL